MEALRCSWGKPQVGGRVTKFPEVGSWESIGEFIGNKFSSSKSIKDLKCFHIKLISFCGGLVI
jgi:hypothetical protein